MRASAVNAEGTLAAPNGGSRMSGHRVPVTFRREALVSERPIGASREDPAAVGTGPRREVGSALERHATQTTKTRNLKAGEPTSRPYQES